MKNKIVIITAVFSILFVCCKDNPMEIQEGYSTLGDGQKINTLCFDTQKELFVFYTAICKDYCQRINPKNSATYYTKFTCYNSNWYKDTFYIASEELICTSLKGDKHTSVFLSFYDKSNLDILKSKDMNYTKLKAYFNDIYIETLK